MKRAKTLLTSLAMVTLMAPVAFAQTAVPTPMAAPDATPKPADSGTMESKPADSRTMERVMLRQPTMEMDGYSTVTTGDITADDLTGASAYGAGDTDIGTVDQLVLSADGKTVDHIVLDIGGFLGMGVHQVALTPAEVQIMRKGTSDVRVYVDATKEELEAQPAYMKK